MTKQNIFNTLRSLGVKYSIGVARVGLICVDGSTASDYFIVCPHSDLPKIKKFGFRKDGKKHRNGHKLTVDRALTPNEIKAFKSEFNMYVLVTLSAAGKIYELKGASLREHMGMTEAKAIA